MITASSPSSRSTSSSVPTVATRRAAPTCASASSASSRAARSVPGGVRGTAGTARSGPRRCKGRRFPTTTPLGLRAREGGGGGRPESEDLSPAAQLEPLVEGGFVASPIPHRGGRLRGRRLRRPFGRCTAGGGLALSHPLALAERVGGSLPG